jgi:hypothetical protein
MRTNYEACDYINVSTFFKKNILLENLLYIIDFCSWYRPPMPLVASPKQTSACYVRHILEGSTFHQNINCAIGTTCFSCGKKILKNFLNNYRKINKGCMAAIYAHFSVSIPRVSIRMVPFLISAMHYVRKTGLTWEGESALS